MEISNGVQKITENITPWLLDHGIKILVIVIVAQLIRKFAGIFIEKLIRKFVIADHFLSKEDEKNEKTP